MIIFDRDHVTNYEFVNLATYEDIRMVADFDGSSRKQGWTAPHVVRGRVSKRSGCKPADLPYGHTGLYMRRSGMEALRDVLEKHGEILPLATEDGVEMWVHNPMVVIDALDKQRSILEPIGESGVVMLRNPAFIESSIGDAEIFMLPMRPRYVYFTEPFVKRVKAAKLKGTTFEKVWSSDEPT